MNGKVKGSGVWTSIVKLFNKLKTEGPLSSNVLRVKVGNGNSIRFWKDNWKGDGSLASKFNRLMYLDTDPDCLLSWRLTNGNWACQWARDIGPRNSVQLSSLIDHLGPVERRDVMDSWEWSLATDCKFNISITRKFIDDASLPSEIIDTIWVKEVPRKVNIFLWRVAWDRLPTRLNG
ncbi:uncharacterized protein [Rutidosis leptorrhynchoides]|uniref:uncharacterized protein n=1 Tax=Rutidosis leptorrhynchoides TaxID=125765 RepID=UPI003A9A191A